MARCISAAKWSNASRIASCLSPSTSTGPELIEKLGATLVSYDIEPAGEAVRLTMTESHDRPLDDDILSGGRQGWPAILSSLKSLLETGEPLVIKMAPPERMLAALKKLGINTPQAERNSATVGE
jgi:hypothetical protein